MPAIQPDAAPDAFGMVSVVVRHNGEPLPDTTRVVSVTVSRAANAVPAARIVFQPELDSDSPSRPAAAAPIKAGDTIAIDAGYDQAVSAIFSGVVVRQGLRVSGERDWRLTVDCRDKVWAATRQRRSRVLTDRTDSDAMQTALGEHGVEMDLAATTVQHPALVQHQCTDWDFAVTRAEANGQVLLVEDGKVRSVEPATDDEPVLSLAEGAGTVLEFEADRDDRQALSGVTAIAWDPANAAAVTGTAQAEGEQPATAQAARLQSDAALPSAVLQVWATARMRKATLARLRCRARVQGTALARPGSVVRFDGFGPDYDGPAWVSAVRHELSGGNWITELETGLDPRWFVERAPDLPPPPAAAWSPPAQSLLIGTVKKLDADPGGAFRVQVTLPVTDAGLGSPETSELWARLVTPLASNTFGTMWLPEIGDEVLVGFVDQQPAHPVVLGALYSAKHPMPATPEATNKLKTLVTRCKSKLEFDDEDKLITLATPAGNKLVFSDKDQTITLQDQHGNKMVFGSSGIEISSPAKITAKATDAMTLETMANLTAKATGNVDVQGMNVSAKANAAFEAQGTASAKLSAAGQVTVQGAIVMIN